MATGTVCLTFDFDAVSLWIQRQQTTPTPVSRGEFGAAAVPRILNLLGSRNLRSTWFIPGHTVETYPGVCREIVEAGHEVGLHGYAHEDARQLGKKQEKEVLSRAFGIVGELVGGSPAGSRSPSWDLSPYSVELMLDLGLTYDSSLMSYDYAPFYARRNDRITPESPMEFGETTRLVEVPVSWSLDDYPAFEYVRMNNSVMPGLRTPEDVFGNWYADLNYMRRDFLDGVLVVTLHPQVIGRGHRMLGLEAWVDRLLAENVEFQTTNSVANHFISGRAFGRYHP